MTAAVDIPKRIAFVLGALTGKELTAGNRDVSHVYSLLTNPTLGNCSTISPKPVHECSSRDQFQQALTNTLSNWRGSDQLIFYFTGHGKIVNDTYCIQVGPLESDLLPFDNLLTDLRINGVRRAILILDTCYSGAATKIKATEHLPSLKQYDLPKGTAILASSRSTETSSELPDGSSSVFTRLFCEGIEGGLNGTETSDGYISVGDLVDFVKKRLEADKQYAAFLQRPVYRVDEADRAIWISKNPSGAFLREKGSSNLKVIRSVEELQLLYDKTQPDKHPCVNASLNDLNWDLVEEFLEKNYPQVPRNQPKEAILEALKLFSPISYQGEQVLHKSAILCFAHKPELFYEQAKSMFVIGNPGDADWVREEVTGPLSSQVLQLIDLVKTNLNVVSYVAESGRRQEKPEIDLDVVRELISNAVTHRDYNVNGAVTVTLTGTTLEIRSPGGFPPNTSWEAFLNSKKPASYPVNLAISHYQSRLLVFEGIGRGFDIFKKYLADNGLDSIICEVLPGPTTLVSVLRQGGQRPIRSLQEGSLVSEGNNTRQEKYPSLPLNGGEQNLALQTAFEDALALMKNGRFHSARNAFKALQEKLDPNSPQMTEALVRQNEAEHKLHTEIQPLIEKAQQYDRHKPTELEQRRALWEAVIELDPDNIIARHSLENLHQEGTRLRIQKEIQELLQGMQRAMDARYLPDANTRLGAIEALAEANTYVDIQPELDEALKTASQQRAKLREILSAASTLSVQGNTREAYKQTREFLTAGVNVMIDAAGFLGQANAEVKTIELVKVTRQRFIASLLDLAQQRRDLAEEQQRETPALAKKTLKSTLELLNDDLLTEEDRGELKDTCQNIENELVRLEEQIHHYEQARALVLKANELRTSFEEKLYLFREAKEIYPYYSNLDNYIADTQDALAAQLAGRVKDKMTSIRIGLSRDEFQKALEELKATRANVYEEVPQPKKGSELEKVLAELEQLNQEIITADGQHHAMMKLLEVVDGLLEEYGEKQDQNLLVEVRQKLDTLPSKQAQHQEVRQRRLRLTNSQGDLENWRQGRDAYRIREWEDAQTFLQKVADNSKSAERVEAEKLVRRAQAASYVEQARQAELERNWHRAIDLYREAHSLFKEHGTDDTTNLLYSDCQDKLDQLKPLEENDQRVQLVISQARSLIVEGQNSVKVRRSLPERVESVPQFLRAVESLLAVRQQDTTLVAELELALRDAREAWRVIYLRGMEEASRSQDVPILQKAVMRGEELQAQSLLFEDKDKQLLQKLQEQLLDTVYANLLAERTPDPAEVEANRRRRWEIANPKTDEIYGQYQTAVEQHTLLSVSNERGKSAEAALQYLKGEMRRPELYQSERIFREFMHLCWTTTNWQEARRQAEALAYRVHVVHAQQKSVVWVGLTQSAHLLEQGNLSGFYAELEGLKSTSQIHPDLEFLLSDEQEWLVNWRLEKLVRDAQEAARSKEETELIKAAQKFAEAHELRGSDSRVKTGLENLGRKLNSNLEIYAGQAKNISIRKSLADSIRHAEELGFILRSIQKVQDVLHLKAETIEALEDGREQIDKKLASWKKVQAQLDRLEKAKVDYLTYPDPLQPDGSGGWRIRNLVEQMTHLLQEAQGDRELILLVATKRDALAELDNKAGELNEQAYLLGQAIQTEAFPQVLESANQLERLWNQYRNEGFSGLDMLIRHRYPFTEKELRQLKEHKDEAKHQQANLEEWENWAERVSQAYREVKAVGGQIDKHLDDLRQDAELDEIKKSCLLVLEKTNEFDEALAKVPSNNPMSQKAAKAKDRVAETWRGEVLENVTSYQNRTSGLMEQIERDLVNFSQPLRQLQNAINLLESQIQQYEKSKASRFRRDKPFPTAQLRNATARLRECQEIDPCHEEVVAANKRLRQIRERHGEG